MYTRVDVLPYVGMYVMYSFGMCACIYLCMHLCIMYVRTYVYTNVGNNMHS
jgi:hypothetical protein